MLCSRKKDLLYRDRWLRWKDVTFQEREVVCTWRWRWLLRVGWEHGLIIGVMAG
jgi:hypothetical protein